MHVRLLIQTMPCVSFVYTEIRRVQRFKGSKVDAYKPLGHSITHTIQCTILCKEETKIGQRNYMKCLACTKISSLPPANNSTINSELTRGEWQLMKCSKWESSAVWLSQSGQGLVPMLGLVRVQYKDWRASVEPLNLRTLWRYVITSKRSLRLQQRGSREAAY